MIDFSKPLETVVKNRHVTIIGTVCHEYKYFGYITFVDGTQFVCQWNDKGLCLNYTYEIQNTKRI